MYCADVEYVRSLVPTVTAAQYDASVGVAAQLEEEMDEQTAGTEAVEASG